MEDNRKAIKIEAKVHKELQLLKLNNDDLKNMTDVISYLLEKARQHG